MKADYANYDFFPVNLVNLMVDKGTFEVALNLTGFEIQDLECLKQCEMAKDAAKAEIQAAHNAVQVSVFLIAKIKIEV